MRRILLWTSRRRLGLFTLASVMAVAVLVVAACGGSSEAATGPPQQQTPATNVPVGAPAGVVPAGVAPSGEVSAADRGLGVPAFSGVQYSSNQQLGISVTGRGEVTTTPDLVILNAGVEARGLTVAEAQVDAAEAMDRVMTALAGRNVESSDIQTRFFNISPEYQWNDRERQQELVGYVVRNQLTVKLRDVDNVGPVIDDVAVAGGDLVRVEGIRFTVDDTTALEIQARELAVQALTAKAQQFATLTGVQLGSPLSLSESGGFTPQIQNFDARAFAEVAMAAPAAVLTPISGGELTVTVTVQGTFSIFE